MLPQSTNTILMVRPACFGYNPETASSNAFQMKTEEKENDIHLNAIAEFDTMVAVLRDKGIEVTVVQDQLVPNKPDAIFPNNWMSTHHDGTLVLYPMMAVNRRLERLNDCVDDISKEYHITHKIDLSSAEQQETFLEGTGSIVFDHMHRQAYACRSPRTDEHLLRKLCSTLQYQPILFDAVDANEKPIYHTNVMMSIGSEICVLCTEIITDNINIVLDTLTKSGRVIMDITYSQMLEFAGNVLEVVGANNQKLLVLSSSAFESMTDVQKTKLKRHVTLVPIHIPTIQKHGGGGVRCMMAEIFAPNL